eukprot:2055905-Ditylum_brightwellii.AAC.1
MTHTQPSPPQQHQNILMDTPVNPPSRKNIKPLQTSANPGKHKQACQYSWQNSTQCRTCRQRCTEVAKRTKHRKNHLYRNNARTNSTRTLSYTKYCPHQTKPRKRTLEDTLCTYVYKAQTEPPPHETPRAHNASSTTAYYSTQGWPPDLSQ